MNLLRRWAEGGRQRARKETLSQGGPGMMVVDVSGRLLRGLLVALLAMTLEFSYFG